MVEQTLLRKTLLEELTKAQIKNPNYTLRAFARKLRMHASAVSEIMSGKRKVSAKLAEKILTRLGTDPDKAQMALRLFSSRNVELEPPYTDLSMEHFKVIADWHHLAILSLTETADFQESPTWIGKRLGIPSQEAEKAIARLEQLGMIERGEDGRIIPTGIQYATPDEISSLALRRLQSQNLELARRALEELEPSQRDFTGLTLAFDPDHLPLVKKMIRDFQDQLALVMRAGKKREVFKVAFQVFPLTQSLKTERKPS